MIFLLGWLSFEGAPRKPQSFVALGGNACKMANE
jgi:hypothetical protein